MKSTSSNCIRPASLVMAAVFVCTAAVAGGADKSSARAEGERYRQECMAGKTHQARATCLKEANNYLADLRKHPAKFESNVNASIAANAKARCEPLSGSERAACVARVSGQGKVEGSVEGGGIYRELVTLENPSPIIQGADTPPPAAADAPPTE